MKNLTLSIVMLLVSLCTSVNAQYVTIPDADLVTYLQSNFPSCMTGNQMDTTCSDIVNATSLSIMNSNVADLTGIQYFDNVGHLTCYGLNNLTTLAPLPYDLRSINVTGGGITSIPSLPDSIRDIYFESFPVTSLPTLPDSIYRIVIRECYQLTSLPTLPRNLKNIELIFSNITSVPLLPEGLHHLYLYDVDVPTIPAPIPTTLKTLTVTISNISSLPSLPNGLEELIVDETNISTLPATLPPNLEVLDFSNTLITTIPPLPATLYSLGCANNQIQYPPTWLPPGLTNLGCSGNLFTYLPSIPSGLTTLYCSNNLLTSLPPMPSTLNNLKCSNNMITELPELPGRMLYLEFDNNPISCFPDVDTIGYLNFTNTNISCKTEDVRIINSSSPSVSGLPKCDATNPGGCEVYRNVVGTVYRDLDTDCVFDVTDIGTANVKVMLFGNGNLVHQVYTSASGEYTFPTRGYSGPFYITVDTLGLPFDVTCPASNVLNFTNIHNTVYNRNFGLTNCSSTNFDVGVHHFFTPTLWVRPANLATTQIHAGDLSFYAGSNCASNQQGQVMAIMSGSASDLQSTGSLPASYINGDTIIWNINDFGTTNPNTSFEVSYLVDTFATINDQICFDVYISSANPDLDPSNNHQSHCIQVATSYDPNNKVVSPIGNIDTTQEWLYYTINFQNTGTAPAQNIRVEDTLSSYFDIATFQLLEASHTNHTEVSETGIINFSFPNIELPDSNFDEPNSHGHVSYRVRLKENLPIGTSIENTAYIYFDYNPAIVTNTTVNRLFTPLTQAPITYSNTSICEGDSVELQTVQDPGYSYTWYINDTAITNSNSPSLIATRNGDYKVSITDGTSSVMSDVETLTFNALPTVSLISPVTDVCYGASTVILTPSPAGGTYAGAMMVNNEFDPVVNNFGLNTIEYYYTDSNGCTDSASVDITVKTRPNVSLYTTINSVCEYEPPITLTPDPVGGAYLGATINGNDFDPSDNNLGSNIIKYYFTDTNGCTDTASINITVHPRPHVSLLTPVTEICEDGVPVFLDPSPQGATYVGATIINDEFDPALNSIGLNTIEYHFTGGFGCTNSTSVDIMVNPKPSVSLTTSTNAICEDAPAVALTPSPTGGSYMGATLNGNDFDPADNNIGLNTIKYYFTDGNGCADTASVDITVNAKPNVSLTASTTDVCENAPAAALTPSPTGGSYMGATLNGNDFDPADNNIGLNTIEYYYTDGNGCADSASVAITVNAKPNVSLTASTTDVCENAPAAALTPSPTGGSYMGATLNGNDFDPADNSIGRNTIKYYYTDGNGCADTATLDITVNALPTVTLALPSDPYCEGGQAVDLSSYAYPAGGTFSGSAVSNDMLDVSVAGTMTVEYTYTDGNGCTDSKQANAIVEICDGIEELEALGINVYPNPASNIIWISLTNNIEVQQVKLIDLSGKEVATATTTNNGFSIDVSELPSQTYLLIMSNKEGKIITSSSIQVAR